MKWTSVRDSKMWLYETEHVHIQYYSIEVYAWTTENEYVTFWTGSVNEMADSTAGYLKYKAHRKGQIHGYAQIEDIWLK